MCRCRGGWVRGLGTLTAAGAGCVPRGAAFVERYNPSWRLEKLTRATLLAVREEYELATGGTG